MTPPGRGHRVCRTGTSRRPPLCCSTTRRSRCSPRGHPLPRAGPGGPVRRQAPPQARTPQSADSGRASGHARCGCSPPRPASPRRGGG
eukprot:15009995-Alexandrium_andersonii.AAC.1